MLFKDISWQFLMLSKRVLNISMCLKLPGAKGGLRFFRFFEKFTKPANVDTWYVGKQ